MHHIDEKNDAWLFIVRTRSALIVPNQAVGRQARDVQAAISHLRCADHDTHSIPGNITRWRPYEPDGGPMSVLTDD